MQWLIDLVIEAIGIPPVFIDRGDPATSDFTLPDLTIDGAWHELDLSAIVPAGASAAAIIIRGVAQAVNHTLEIRPLGNANPWNIAKVNTTVAWVEHTPDKTIPLDADRKVEYRGTGLTWASITITVKGWWL